MRYLIITMLYLAAMYTTSLGFKILFTTYSTIDDSYFATYFVISLFSTAVSCILAASLILREEEDNVEA